MQHSSVYMKKKMEYYYRLFLLSYKYIFQIFIKTVLYKFKELEKQLIYLRFKSSSIKQTKLCLMNAINKNDNDN